MGSWEVEVEAIFNEEIKNNMQTYLDLNFSSIRDNYELIKIINRNKVSLLREFLRVGLGAIYL